MKIGILTYYDGINFGAYAQVYALHKRLKELGYENKVVAYKNKTHYIGELKALFYTKNPKFFFTNLIKLIKFRLAQKKLNTTINIQNANKINDLGLDIIIVGSDEVWNFKNDLFGIDGAYFGIPFKKSRLISYAGCFGKVSVDDKIPSNLINGLKKFKNLSVRDDNTYNIIEKTLQIKPTLVLDPTLLYNYDISDENILLNENYILFYGIDFEKNGESIIKQIKQFASKKNMRIISVGFKHSWADQNIVTITPFEWMKYIKNASYIITNMFHGTVFSIKYNKQFLTVGSQRRKNKVESLLKHMELSERVVYFDNAKDCLSDKLELKIDYDRVNKIIKEEKKKSEDFLLASIDKN